MSVDYKYEKYAELYPRQYEFIMSCNFGQAREAVNDPDCPGWAKELLEERFKSAFEIQKKNDDKKKAEALKFLQEHLNADICIVNLALAIYGENSKRMMCDKISLDTALDEAFELYKRHFD